MRPFESRRIGFGSLLICVSLLGGCGQQPAQKQAATPSTTEQRPETPPQTPVSTDAAPPGALREEEPAAPASEPQRPAPTKNPAVAPPRRPTQRREIAENPPAASSPAETPPSKRVAEAASAPAPIVKTLPAGAEVDVILMDGLSSETSQAGDTVRARVANDVMQDGVMVIPAGSIVSGTVTEVVPLKKIGGAAKLALSFGRLEITAANVIAIEANLLREGKSQTGKDAATIGGAAAGGAVLGKLLGKSSKDTLIGAVVGAAAGTAVAAKNKGEQVELPVGTQMSFQLNRPVEITVRP